MRYCIFLLIIPMLLNGRDWTTLMYMVADNNLAEFADSDLVEMELIGSSDDCAIVVQLDKPSIGARRLLVRDGFSLELQNLGTIDMCNWQTLADFIEWGVITYPADKYLLVLWDHGTGWTACGRTFGSDGSSGTQMSISDGELRKAISTAYSYTGELIDVFAFDACLMEQIEVAFEVHDYAKIFLAPQTLCPGEGFRYDSIFGSLRRQPSMSARTLARHIIKSNVGYYTDVHAVAYGAIDLTHLKNFQQELYHFINEVIFEDPMSGLVAARASVQTIPVSGLAPNPHDEHVDVGDFLKRYYTQYPSTELGKLLVAYNDIIITSGFSGEQFAGITGLTTWFPLQYRDFKQLLDYYKRLTWTGSYWLQFLNWFYGVDDIRPTDVSTLQAGSIGNNNDFRLSWRHSYDLAPVTYNVIEAHNGGIVTLFSDDCEELDNWHLNGFNQSSTQHHSGSYSFFSGNESNLRNILETNERIFIEDLGIVRVFLNYHTEDMNDSLIIEYGSFQDVHYGRSLGWQERIFILPPGNHTLRFIYITNESDNLGGCYIDDVVVNHIEKGYYVKRNCADTSLYIYNKLKGNYLYAVYPEDWYHNTGNLSDFLEFTAEQYAVPYSNPNPFHGACEIILDYPEALRPTVEIFSISGRRVKRFVYEDIIDNKVPWNAKDEQGREVGAGLYFVVIKDGEFKKIGKIARQQ